MASRYEAVPHCAAAPRARYPNRGYNQPAPPVQYSQPSYGRQNFAAPPPPASYPHSGYNQPAPPIQYSQPSYGQPSYGQQNYGQPVEVQENSNFGGIGAGLVMGAALGFVGGVAAEYAINNMVDNEEGRWVDCVGNDGGFYDGGY